LTYNIWDNELDTSGLLCPLPVLKTRKTLKGMEPGDVLKLHVDDPAGIVDIPHYCNETKNKILKTEISGKNQVYFILKL
tara:strand:- start:1185 stop:1421 length:237 start_codon:yes stop_codon:yes gene_type:complete